MTEPHTPTDIRQHAPVKGIVFMIVQTALLAVIAVLVKILSAHGHNPVELTFWRSALMVLPVWLLLILTNKKREIGKANIKAQIIRALTGTLTMLFMFITYTYLPLSEAQSLFFTTPLFIVALSWPVLGEKVGPYRITAAFTGFAGVLLMLQPGAISSVTGAIFGLLSALGMCAITLLLRTLGRTQDPLVTIFYFTLVGTIVTAPAMPFFWHTPSATDMLLIVCMAALALGNQYFLTRALFIAPPSVTSPVSYVGLLWALLLDSIIWSDFPSALTLSGAAVVILSNLFILYRERKHARQTA